MSKMGPEPFPLSQAHRDYLAAFDVYLVGPPAARAGARQRMDEALAAMGVRSRRHEARL
jgi:hypothetical protein